MCFKRLVEQYRRGFEGVWVGFWYLKIKFCIRWTIDVRYIEYSFNVFIQHQIDKNTIYTVLYHLKYQV